MGETATAGRSWPRTGCIGVAVLALVAALVGAGLSGVAFLQNRSSTAETRHLEQALPSTQPDASVAPGAGEAPDTPPAVHRVLLDIVVGQVTVVPGPPGSGIRVGGIFDPRRFELSNVASEGADGKWTTRIALLPLGSEAWELWRVKVGGSVPLVRIVLPAGTPFELQGSIRKGFGALELGGLWVRSADLDVQGGNVALSFLRPTQEPMQHVNVKVTTGALKIGQLGNASPRQSSLIQGFGALDVDLRGAWQNDTDVQIGGRTAAGSVWLPTDMRIEGVTRPSINPPIPTTPAPEIEPLTLRLNLDSRANTIILID